MKSKVDIAKETAEKVHGSQTDKKNYPYMAHVNDVAKRVQQSGEDYFIVGLLHDAIEDAVKHNEGARFQEEIKDLIAQSPFVEHHARLVFH